MKINKVEVNRPPVNTTVTINNESCKVIVHDNKTWINIKDLTLKGKEEVYNLVKNAPGLLEQIIELSLYGQGDYYVEATHGLEKLVKAIDEKNFWY